MPLRLKLTEPEQLLNPQQEAGAANPTDQNGDLHIARQYCPAAALWWAHRGCLKVAVLHRLWATSGEVEGTVIDTPKAQNNRNAEIRSRDGMEMRRSA
jgi:hypothetical protein